ncbi:DEAD/DEAH box helicase [Sulfitobacter sabulilitoris]|uniref:DEAD/DEAH box helicase n=1 Tax=Sulfitobacter sabulilitoris TaxID=2562655 RepID=A0A5S3PFJ9_9RHOB|nr:DEAD/DEAH box helicase [Sulfitobacter sabulilitoris]TMM52825.1 DEAD/DEAH box helicase [Sulfitobacter sabulilitoris]
MIQTISDALAQQGYDTLTPVQDAVTDPALAQADLLVSAQTGSGKTVGFGLAIAQTLLGDADRFAQAGAPLALVIAPTRELAMQVSRELTWLYAKAGAVVTTCVGGMDARAERRTLDRGVHVVVATPGRLCDHIKRGNIDLSQIRAVVLDEADEMLDLGFREELEFILSESPDTRRTLMFSATVPPAIAKLAKSYQKDAQRVETVSETRQHADIEYRALNVHPSDLEKAIINLLRLYEAQNAIVFCNTRAAVARLTTKLTNRGFSVVALSGELTQSERTNALQALRDGRARVCVATDVAARGIDLPNLELVIHADLPSNSDTLLHRSGRTGRAGRKGVSALIVPPKLRTKANRLLGGAKLRAEWGGAPTAAEVTARDEERLLGDPAWTEAAPEEAQEFVAQLIEKFSAEQLASAFVNLYRARQSAPEELNEPGAPGEATAPRGEFGPSVWFSVSTGRNDGAEPRTLLPMLCRLGDLTKDDIGAIRIQPSHSFVEILAARADAFIASVGPDMTLEAGAKLTRLDAAPNLDRGPKPGGKPRGPKPDFKKPARATKPAYDPLDSGPVADAPRPAPAPKAGAVAETPKPFKPAAAPKGKRPPKSHKTERSPMKPGATPKPKSGDAAPAPRAKPVWTKDRRDAPPRDRQDAPADRGGDKSYTKGKGAPKGKPNGKPAGKPFAKPGAKPAGDGGKSRAADPSKRFSPPKNRGKQGANATPRRKP